MDYLLGRRIPGAYVRLGCTGMYFFEDSDPGCVEDFVDLDEI